MYIIVYCNLVLALTYKHSQIKKKKHFLYSKYFIGKYYTPPPFLYRNGNKAVSYFRSCIFVYVCACMRGCICGCILSICHIVVTARQSFEVYPLKVPFTINELENCEVFGNFMTLVFIFRFQYKAPQSSNS